MVQQLFVRFHRCATRHSHGVSVVLLQEKGTIPPTCIIFVLQLIEFLPLDDEGDGDADDYHTEKDENED